MDQDHKGHNEEELKEENPHEKDLPAEIEDVLMNMNLKMAQLMSTSPMKSTLISQEFMTLTISLQDLLVLILSQHTLPNQL